MEAENKENSTLEEMFQELDGVTGQLESTDVTLEDSFALYNKGMQLLKKCNETIDTVEKKVMMLDENGETHEF